MPEPAMPKLPLSRETAPDRRSFCLGALAAAVPALPLAAQDKPAPRRFLLRAEAFQAKLGGKDAPESRLFRFALKDAPPAPFVILRTRVGEPFEIEIENTLDQPTGFHLRGMRGPNAADGVPGLTQEAIAPGGKHTLALPGTQAGTFILAPSLPGRVAEQNARGLFAVVIVEEKDADPTLFDHDLVLAFSDWRLDDRGALSEDFLALPDSARLGRLGNKLVVNALEAPARMEVRPGARIRLRMVNVANARVVPIKVSGFPAEVFAIDSTPCQPFDPLKRTVIMAPATRIEMVLQAAQEPGQTGAVEARLGDGLPLYTFRTAGSPIPARGKLAALPDPGLPPAIRLQDATRAELAIEGGIGLTPQEAEPEALGKRFPAHRQVFTLSTLASPLAASPLAAPPRTGSPETAAGYARPPVARVKKNGVLVLALHNRTAWPQVLGVHGHAFRLLHAYDDGWEPYFLDTLYLAPKTTARIALIAENAGKWAIRSTLAEHYGAGVATWFEVI